MKLKYMNKTFTHKDHSIEIVNDRSKYLTYIVSVDGSYVGDVNNTFDVAIDQARAYVDRTWYPEPVPSWLRAARAGTHVGYAKFLNGIQGIGPEQNYRTLLP